jgi:hypothetical protein
VFPVDVTTPPNLRLLRSDRESILAVLERASGRQFAKERSWHDCSSVYVCGPRLGTLHSTIATGNGR